MATLEVRDGQGKLQRVEMTREHPLLFGSNARCDIVLTGPGILPFHGRVRWKSSRYKADASPEAEYLVINGTKMTSSSLRRGDQITIGPCRITMLYEDDDDRAAEDDKTRVQPAPLFAQAGAAAGPSRPAPLRRGEWRQNLREMRGPETAVAEPEEEEKKKKRGLKGITQGGWEGLWRTITAGDRPPGEERILTSPLVIGLVCAFALLVVLGIGLRAVIVRTSNNRLYTRAQESMDDGDYRNAIQRFDQFLAANSDPTDKRVSKAKVERALASVRQFTSVTGASWSHALEAEREMYQSVAGEEAYRDYSTDLADAIIQTGEALADRARNGADRTALNEAESAVALLHEVASQAAPTMLGKSRLPAKMSEARAAVKKAGIRKNSLASMDEALKASSSTGVYLARDTLVRQYADLAGDREVLSRMTKANELIRKAVKFDEAKRPAETKPHAEPFGPPTSLVLRAFASGRTAAPARSADGPVVFALADGFLYALDGTSGAPLWHKPVGLSSPYPPQAVPGGTSVLAVDARHDELLRYDGRTGELVWRQAVDGPVADPPLILGNQIIQPTLDGTLVFLDLKSGERQGIVRLGLKATSIVPGAESIDVPARTPVSDEAGQFLYVVADKDCLFIFKRDPLECVSVEYIGHQAGSVPCAPARSARFLIIPENHTLNETRWRVLLLDEEGSHAKPVQQLTFPGWTWDTPPTAGSVVFAVGDRAGVSALSIGSYDQKDPIRPLAKINADARESGPAFGIARTERELWVSSGRSSRYDLDLERGSIKSGWSLAEHGASLAPVQVVGELMVLTQQYTDGPGVALLGIDAQSGNVRWRTVLGTPWPIELGESPDGEGLTTLASDGRAITITKSTLVSGGFVEIQLPRPGAFKLPEGRLSRLESEGLSVIVPGSDANYLLARAGNAEFRRIDLPTPVDAAPILWGKDVLIAGADGRVYLVDPLTGESKAEPYIPSFDRSHPTRWRSPVMLDGDAVALVDESGRVRRLTRPTTPRPRLVVLNEVNLGKDVPTEPASTGGAVVAVTADGRVRSLTARDLSPAGAWPLDAPLAVPPAAVSGRCFLADKTGGIVVVGAEGQRLWSAKLRDSVPTGPPVIKDDACWFLASDGSLQRLSLKEGTLLDRIDLGILPAGGLRTVGSELAVPVAVGTVRLLDAKALSTGKTAGGE